MAVGLQDAAAVEGGKWFWLAGPIVVSFRVGSQHAHPANIHHTVLVLWRQPVLVIVIVLVLVIVIEKNIAIAEPLLDHDRRDICLLSKVYFGFSFDFPVELRQRP